MSRSETGPDEVSLLWRQIAGSPARSEPWSALAACYASRGLRWQAAYTRRQALRLNRSAAPDAVATRGEPGPAGVYEATPDDSVLGRPRLPQATSLADRFAAQLESSPGDWLTWLYLARLRELGGSDANADFAMACRFEPLQGESWHWLGVWRLQAGDAPGAVAALSRLIDVRPVRCGSMMFLGEALFRLGKVEAAEKAFTRASSSSTPDFLVLLAQKVHALNYWQEAIALLKKSVDLQADFARGWLALATLQSEVYQLGDCRESLRQLRALVPDHPEAGVIEAGLQGRYGDAAGQLDQLESAYATRDDPGSRLASSIAMTSLYHDGLTPAQVADRHRRLCAPIEAALARPAAFANPTQPSRRLRIGFVSGDLHRQHPVNLFMQPLLPRIDRERFEIAIYHTGEMHDAYTARARRAADRWLEAARLDDAELREAIMADGIDLLVDLAGHTAGHRLGVFAMRSAPVQATFLGYPHSTGLASMDWIVGDAIVSPLADAPLYSERLAQMPHSVWCWAPIDAHPLPASRPDGATVVFGSFNNAIKLSPATIALWAQVLRAVPDALLLLKAPSLRDETVKERLSRLFRERGVDPRRLRFRGPSGLDEMMQEYGDIDIALDPLPYNGGTTTLQALWMGVPVVTLTGGNFASRMGTSFMTALGRTAWVAADEAAYVDVACRLVLQVEEIRAGRAGLRARMAASPLCDIASYASDLQALMRRMWQAHCNGDPARVIRAEPPGRAQGA